MRKENNRRKYPGERGRRPDNAKFRRDEATKNAAAYSKLSIKEKLLKLDEKLGPGQGAERQRARLMAQLERQLNPSVETDQADKPEVVSQKKHMKAKERREQEKKSAPSKEEE